MSAIGFLLLLQAGVWSSAPSRPTVGDTIWLERTMAVTPGWRVRAGKLEAGPQAEPLGDAVITAAADGWVIRYPVVAWAPGAISIAMPPLWRLGPDGTADSVSGGFAVLAIASVIPDSVRSPGPQPALGLFRLARTNPIPLLAALLVTSGLLWALVAWRRRAPRSAGAAPVLALDPAVADARWLAAGEPKAVAARAARHLRNAIAQAIPDAHEALSTSECLAAVERARPQGPIRELRELLTLLDQVSFATAHAVDVAPLSARAQQLAKAFTENGKP